MNTFETIVLNLTKGEKVKAVAGGITGVLDEGKSKLIWSPHIVGWIGRPFKGELAKRLNCNVDVTNDSAVVGLGEAHRGAGIGFNEGK